MPHHYILVSSEGDIANWDRWAVWLATHSRELLIDKDKVVFPVFCSNASPYVWDSLYPSAVNVVIVGSMRRFPLTEKLINHLADNSFLPSQDNDNAFNVEQDNGRKYIITPDNNRLFTVEKPGLFDKKNRARNEESYALVLVAGNVPYPACTVPPSKFVDKQLRRLVLVMGCNGPATLAATVALMHDLNSFETFPERNECCLHQSILSQVQVCYQRDGDEEENRKVRNSVVIQRKWLFENGSLSNNRDLALKLEIPKPPLPWHDLWA